jgi:hypothetical protein
MTKKDAISNTVISMANRLKNLTDENQDEKELLIAEIISFLKTLDKHELNALSYGLKQAQIPELGKIAAMLCEIAAEKELH